MSQRETVFSGSIPELYDALMVPMIFAPYASELADRVAKVGPSRVLEIAAGTGVVTRSLTQVLPATVEIVATDLSQPMLDRATAIGTSRPVRWQQADALSLPFDAASFDVVVCQFGVMFFPDKVRGFAEFRRVLKPGGVLLFNVWDRLETNEFAHLVTTVVGERFASNPPLFMRRLPHGYFDQVAIKADLSGAGFGSPTFETVTQRSRAPSPREPARAYCQGTPFRGELEERGADIAEMTALCTDALAARFGSGPIDGQIQAHVVTVQKS